MWRGFHKVSLRIGPERYDLVRRDPGRAGAVIARVHARAEEMAGGTVSLKALLKRASLPRLAKAVTQDGSRAG